MTRHDNLPPSEADSADLRRMVEEFAFRLARVEAQAREAGDPSPRDLSDARLAQVVHIIYRVRRKRELFFPGDLFGDPAWDMLLDLFVNRARGLRVSTTSLAIAADVPLTTALRWIVQLESHGLLRRFAAPDDARVTVVEITDEAYRTMRRFVTEGLARCELPAPSS